MHPTEFNSYAGDMDQSPISAANPNCSDNGGGEYPRQPPAKNPNGVRRFSISLRCSACCLGKPADIALCGGVSSRSRQRVPLAGLRKILIDPAAVLVHDAEPLLRVCVAVFRGPAIPIDRLAVRPSERPCRFRRVFRD